MDQNPQEPNRPQFPDNNLPPFMHGGQRTQPFQGPSHQNMQPIMVPMMPQGMMPPPRDLPDYKTQQMPQPGPARGQQAISRQISSRPPPTAGSAGVQAPRAESIERPNVADEYLDRVDNNPELIHMLSGAPSKTVHTSAIPSSSRHHRSPSLVDKPLPDPFTQQSGNLTKQTKRDASQGGTVATDNRTRSHGRQMSLSEGLHPHSHGTIHIPDGDRYPTFPGVGTNGGGRGHSRQSSYGSVDPAGLPLPL